MTLLSYFDRFATAYQPYKGGSWCYEDGCIYRGLAMLNAATGEARWQSHLRRLIDVQITPDGALAGYDPDEFNIDNILSGRVLFDLGAVETGDGAATFIMQIAGFLVGFTALAVEIAWHPPIWLHLIIWLPLVAALALGLMRPGKGLMTALQMLRTRDPK